LLLLLFLAEVEAEEPLLLLLFLAEVEAEEPLLLVTFGVLLFVDVLNILNIF
jgi:hypothetical protein